MITEYREIRAVPLDSPEACEQLASRPALLVDLALAYLPRRMVLVQGLTAVLGRGAMGKVASRWKDANEAIDNLRVDLAAGYTIRDVVHQARKATQAVAALEDSVWTLITAAAKRLAQTEVV